MGTVRRLTAIIGTAATLCGLAALPAAAAPPTTITVGNGISFEHRPACSNTAPYPCGPMALNLTFRVATSRMSSSPITVGWQIFGGTATPGVDFTGPTSGTATIAANTVSREVPVPLVYDGFGEPTETFNVRLTSASIPADISSVGTQTIWDGSRIPADCQSLSKNAPNHMAMTCTNRPAAQRWYLYVECFYGWGDPAIRGNDVIGNGTSSGTCTIGQTTNYISFQTY
jgi:hypothetical protein